MDVANPVSSRAVLIGSATYDKLTALPSVLANLTDLRDALTDVDVWGLPPTNVTVIADEADQITVYRALRAAASATEPDGLLLYYYAGHGLLDAGDLVLGLPDTDPQYPDEQSLRYAKLREATRQSVTSRRVVILDCCFAGRAGRDVLSAEDAVRRLGHHDAEDACLLLAVGANKAATAPLRDRNTAFTGTLLEVLISGSNVADPVLTIRTITDEVTQRLVAAGHERPELRLSNRAADMPLVRAVRIRRRDLTGAVLSAGVAVTDPELRDVRMLVLRHDDSGAIGVRLNRPGGPLPDSLNGWRERITPPAQVFDGGPIARDGFHRARPNPSRYGQSDPFYRDHGQTRRDAAERGAALGPRLHR
jgi:putative transcriptional regulator